MKRPPCLERDHGFAYLEDAGTELFGLRIWGTPWQPWFYGWAFNAPRRHGERFLASKFDLIPAGTELLICHGPPRGTGRSDGQPHVGSTALTEAIERIQPPLMVCEHIHSGCGRYRLRETEIVNAAYVDKRLPAGQRRRRDHPVTRMLLRTGVAVWEQPVREGTRTPGNDVQQRFRHSPAAGTAPE